MLTRRGCSEGLKNLPEKASDLSLKPGKKLSLTLGAEGGKEGKKPSTAERPSLFVKEILAAGGLSPIAPYSLTSCVASQQR